jgi:sterol desaturase/sphingolipid hydroxylase (fatty acid hydroxylase superfamily)
MIASLWKFSGDIVQQVGVFLVIFALASIVERRHPIEVNQSKSEIFLDYKLVFANVILSRVFAPISGVVVARFLSLYGSGFIPLRADGWWFPLSLAIVVFAVEVQGYWFHRFQHSIPLFWSMHSLHHSAEAMTMATGARHYWLEQAIIFAVLPSVAVLFKVPHEIWRVVPYFFLTEYVAHMNIKVAFGPLIYVFNTPQYHRIHHSVEPRHHDKNFCKNFPIVDIIFGTAWIPAKDECTRTGLPNEKPLSLLDGIVWPLRHVTIVRRLLGTVSSNQRRAGTSLTSEAS